MTRTTVGPRKWSTAVAVALSTTALISAAPAAADGIDDAFVAALRNYGITVNDPDAAVARGRAVCAGLDSGQDSGVQAMRLWSDPALTMSARQAGFFVGVSVAAYCPQYKGTLDPSMDWVLLPFVPPM